MGYSNLFDICTYVAAPGDLGTSFSFLFPRLQSCLVLSCPVALSYLNFFCQLVYETLTVYYCSHSVYHSLQTNKAVCSNSVICGFAAWYIVTLFLLNFEPWRHGVWSQSSKYHNGQLLVAHKSPFRASNESPPYPPCSLEHVASYTDRQILHYICTNQILDRQAKQERDEFLRQVGITADGERTQTTSAPTE